MALITFVVLFGCWAFIVRAAPRPVESRWIEGIYERKEEDAAALKGPKFVIVGGSGTHFSYSARILSEETGLPFINLGSHAGLGGEYILYRARASLRPGDTVVLALEHQLLADSAPSTVLTHFAITSDPMFLLHVSIAKILPLAFGYSPVQLVRQVSANSVPWNSPLYRAETVDEFGDETVNVPGNKLPYMAQIVKELAPVWVGLPDPGHPPGYLVEFAGWAKEKNINLIQAWPPTTYREAYNSAKYAAYFNRYSDVFAKLGFKPVGIQNDFLIPEEDMLDSMYHADANGAATASRALAVDLCRSIACLKKPSAQFSRETFLRHQH
ncbi:hypothetical protein J2W42_006312 [Rhizobium tibeticum]|uniref:hypothetical protein n=1 Tax=Rhizobium tibeticum TaxID=501024 RepID=UPI002782C706|nr:hypothetical protein [Rhizobium tibeticum]MDP9813438.1 hypothetical protein [Rhizobium tibeticum]